MTEVYREIIDQQPEDTLLVEEQLVSESSSVPIKQQHRKVSISDVVVVLAILGLVIAGYYVRSIGRNWDDYTQLHPDERFLTDVASTIRSGPRLDPAVRTDMTLDEQFRTCYGVNQTDYGRMTVEQKFEAREALGRGGYFDAVCSELNPNVVKPTIFVYGSYPLFTTRALAETYSSLTGEATWTSYTSIRLVGRTMNAVFDTLSILLVFLIGARLFNRWLGLLAALLYVFAVFPIQQSHFWTADAFTAFWVLLAVYFAVRALDNAGVFPERFAALAWLGLGIGIWLWDMPNTNEVTILAPLLYLTVFIGVGLLNTLSIEHQNMRYGVGGALVGGLVLFGAAIVLGASVITIPAAIAASIALIALTAIWLIGYQSFAAYAGSWIWVASAFSLWVYDSLANYGVDANFRFYPPRADLLAAYVLLFTAAGLLASGLRHVRIVGRNTIHLTLAIGVPFFIAWVALVLAAPIISFWGAIAALVLAIFVAAATYWGWQDEVGFGLAFGAALAGRVNVAPLVGVLLLALLIRALPLLLDYRIYRYERNTGLTRIATGLFLAGIATVVAFRFLQPHAFLGPNVLGIVPNSMWLGDIREAQRLVSGKAEIPPNWQWANRTPWLYPLQNIVLYGLGWPLGLAAVVGVVWGIARIIRGKNNWTRLALPVAWISVYFGWLGQNWVTTMRYFMPLYGLLTLLAAWAVIELFKVSYRYWREAPKALSRRAALVGVGLVGVLVVAHTVFYGIGFTNVLTTQMTRVAAARYAMEFIPGDFGLYIEGDDGQTRMINVGTFAYGTAPNVQTLEDGQSLRHSLNPAYSVNVTEVALNLLRDSSNDEAPERVRVSVWSVDSSGAELLLGAQLIETDLSDNFSPYGKTYQVDFEPPVALYIDPQLSVGSYYVEIEVIDGGPITLASNISDPLAPEASSHLTVYYADPTTNEIISSENISFEQPEAYDDVAYFAPGTIHPINFEANYTGVIRHLVIPHVSDPFNDIDDETLRVTLIDGDYRVSGEISGNFNTADDGHLLFGPSVEILLDEPFRVESGKFYTLELQPLDYIGIAGSAVAWEGPWDDPMPTVVCPVPNGQLYRDDLPSGLCTLDTPAVNLYSFHYIGLTMMMHWDDEPEKRDITLDILNQTDYIIIGSNRFYDSFSRIPSRWPMSNAYYDALFSGELGFELEKTFTSYAHFGPFEWPDQVLPSQDVPDWRNEFEAEEAFHVYTHPAVFIFRKTEAYTPELAERILNVNLNAAEDASPALWWQIGSEGTTEVVNRLRWGALPATASPTALQFTQAEREIQAQGGTWADMFNRDALYNRHQSIGVILWWGVMVLMGWLTFPLLHWIFAGLPDRGFGLSKLVGWLVVAWVAWFGASLRYQIWTQTWLLILTVTWFTLNAVIAFWHRHALRQFISQRWKHLLFVEGLSLVLFLAFIGVRLGNPDLWHSPFGGEKPMNVAYFNAVLRSSIFPPIDPWYAGGYINYYYWGYVLVGAPTKLLGVIPSFAYNLILPTLFSWTGIGAFSIAYNLVQWSNERRKESHLTPSFIEKFAPRGNPYLAGIAALMLAVVLGNLGTLRVINSAVAAAGGWNGAAAYEEQALQLAINDFRATQGREPTPEEYEAMAEEVSLSNLEATQKWLKALWDGLMALSKGDAVLSVPPHRWYWAPTRIIAELPDGRGHNAINEMPYFTFLYGDLHAHMMAMPVTLLVVLMLSAEILGAGMRLRSALGSFVALLLLGGTVGMLRAINTWDWPTYMVLSVFGLTFAAWVGQRRLRSDAEPSPLYARLREYLDFWHLLRVWWLVGFVFVGMALYIVLNVYQVRDYEQRLEDGQIPAFCTEIDPEVNLIIPEACEGNLRPEFSYTRMLMAGGLALGIVAFLYIAGLVLLGNRFTQDALAVWIARLITFGSASLVAVWPYMERFASAYGKILSWKYDKTPLWAYINIHGVFLFIIFSLLVWQTARWLRQHKVADLRGFSVPVLSVLGIIALTIVLTLYLGIFGEYKIFVIALPMLIWVFVLFLLPDQSQIERWVYVLIGLALGLTMAVEVVVLQGDIGRQNTVFKFYIQVWLLFSIAAGIGLSWLMRSVERWTPTLAGSWQFAVAILLSIALLYPITATQGRFEDRMNAAETPLTLDGMEYMRYAPHGEAAYQKAGVWFNLSGDYYLIRWLQDNVEGTPTIIEAQHPEQYRWASRISINTGLPTILGWHFHQTQQRNLPNFDRLLATRFNNVKAFYETTDIEATWELIQFYDIEYIVVGTLERILYEDVLPPDPLSSGGEADTFRTNLSAGLDKFDTMVELGLLEVVYQRGVCIHPNIRNVTDCPPERVSTDLIYHVVDGANYEPSALVMGALE